MNRTAVVILVLAVALLGGAVGLVGGIVFARQAASLHLPWGGRPPAPGPPPGGRPPLSQVLPRLVSALDLTPEQVRRIEPKVLASRREFEAARESLRSRIDVELTPEQRVRWREMQRARDRERDRRPPFPGDRGLDGRDPVRPRAGEPGAPR